MNVYVWTDSLKNAYIWEYVPPLNFTANTAWSTVKLTKNWNPTSVTLETSTDGSSWSTYTMWNTITLSNIWDKVYFRNTSETDTGFSTSTSNYYQFVMSWSIAASWDVTSLLNKNWTTTLSARCFYDLFLDCTSLTTTPKLSATTLAGYCYQNMFRWCTSLTSLPKLPATTLAEYCYQNMFRLCSNIKISLSKTWDYQTEYRIPTTWTGTTWTNSMSNMFYETWWTFKWAPTINTTYYTSNTVV